MERPQEELFQKRYRITAYCVLPIMAYLIGWHCAYDSVHADPRARFSSTQNLKTI